MMSTLFDAAARAAFFTLSPPGPGGRLSTLIFHRVLPEPDAVFPDEMHAAQFDTVCGWIARWFKVMPLEEAVQRLARRSLPARALCITFDDGYADNHDVAMPILQRHGLCATLFVATGYLDGGTMWNDTIAESVRRAIGPAIDLSQTPFAALGRLDVGSPDARRRAILQLLPAAKYLPPQQRQAAAQAVADAAGVVPPKDLMMSTGQVRAWRQGGMQVGAHTVSHPILARATDDEVRHEMNTSRQVLRDLLREPVNLFAYPNGRPGDDYVDRTAALAREAGFAAAMSTAPGVARHGSDPYRLPRFSPWDQTRARYAGRLAMNYRNVSA